ncbi:MAG TPA: hypothetical protein VFQ48_03150 [Pseudonocardiaceae bacterium]|jgi:hypothetical protein|nr:hypothetical protein [Pseudonocardiaceae bacterium]
MYIVERRGISLGALVYLIIGLVVALSTGYSITSIGELLNFILALFLWPLVLLGVNFHIFA